mmetsp:Transcript_61939/g.182982  ORF Transcript_61939/g.182982 Transcript_61939/m.182982 type:complete len:392 (-) Transcript_61939:460-1635(-)
MTKRKLVVNQHRSSGEMRNSSDGVADPDDDDAVESLRRAYKKAKREHKSDKSDEGLKKAKRAAKKAWERALAGGPSNDSSGDTNDRGANSSKGRAGGDSNSSDSDGKDPDGAKEPSLWNDEPQAKEAETSAGKEGAGAGAGAKDASASPGVGDDLQNGASSASDDRIETLESAYRAALAAFKANKSDKDLRRARTAARRAFDAAVLAASGGLCAVEQLTCQDCSQKFVFTAREKEYYRDNLGFDTTPKRCKACGERRRARLAEKRVKLDGGGGEGAPPDENEENEEGGSKSGSDDGKEKVRKKKCQKNMCYAFQRGECPHGDKCKFSHNPKHGGKRSRGGGGSARGTKGENETEEQCQDESERIGDDSGLLDAKARKERSLKRKGKGWRNK